MARRTPTPSTRPARRAPRDATADTSASAAELERYPRPSVAVVYREDGGRVGS